MDASSWWPEPNGLNRVIVPVVAPTVEEAEQQAKVIAQSDADLVEWRADYLSVPLPGAMLAVIAASLVDLVAPKPLLFTWRTADEGGQAPVEADTAYAEIVAAVLQTKSAGLVDIQTHHRAATALMQLAKQCGVPVVGSWHDQVATPSSQEIVDALVRAWQMGASVAKVAVTPHDQADAVVLLGATLAASDAVPIPLITISMGAEGLVSRVFGQRFGSSATFATIGAASAPGQLELPALKQWWAKLAP